MTKNVETVKVAGGADYAMVVNRVHAFKEMYENGQILTEIVHNIDGQVIFKAQAIVDGIIRGTGHAMEREGSNNINKTSHIECAETSAIGRCLAFGVGLMPSGQVASFEEIENAKLQQSKIGEHEKTLETAAIYVTMAFKAAIANEDEDGILEVLGDFKGNPQLKSRCWQVLDSEEAQYMTERAVHLQDKKKAKAVLKQEKIAEAVSSAKE